MAKGSRSFLEGKNTCSSAGGLLKHMVPPLDDCNRSASRPDMSPVFNEAIFTAACQYPREVALSATSRKISCIEAPELSQIVLLSSHGIDETRACRCSIIKLLR